MKTGAVNMANPSKVLTKAVVGMASIPTKMAPTPSAALLFFADILQSSLTIMGSSENYWKDVLLYRDLIV